MAGSQITTPLFIIDASVVLKWFLLDNEGETKQALLIRDKFVAGELRLRAPELLIIEVANVLRHKPGDTAKIVNKATSTLWQMDFLAPLNPAVNELAVELAFELNTTIYDAVYLALAEVSFGKLITADAKFYRASAVRRSVQLLKNFD